MHVHVNGNAPAWIDVDCAPVIRNAQGGGPVWDLNQYAFIGVSERHDAPDTVNPSLWRIASS